MKLRMYRMSAVPFASKEAAETAYQSWRHQRPIPQPLEAVKEVVNCRNDGQAGQNGFYPLIQWSRTEHRWLSNEG